MNKGGEKEKVEEEKKDETKVDDMAKVEMYKPEDATVHVLPSDVTETASSLAEIKPPENEKTTVTETPSAP